MRKIFFVGVEHLLSFFLSFFFTQSAQGMGIHSSSAECGDSDCSGGSLSFFFWRSGLFFE